MFYPVTLIILSAVKRKNDEDSMLGMEGNWNRVNVSFRGSG